MYTQHTPMRDNSIADTIIFPFKSGTEEARVHTGGLMNQRNTQICLKLKMSSLIEPFLQRLAAEPTNETIKIEVARAQLGHTQRQDTAHVVT